MKQTGKDPEQELLKIYKIQAEAHKLINMVIGRYTEAIEGRLIKADMEATKKAVDAMAEAAVASIIREKNRLQTVTIHQDPTTKGILVTVQPAPRDELIRQQIDCLVEALEMARLAGHPSGN